MGPVIVLQPPCCALTPKAFPLGGRCPSAHTGADEGAILYPTFPCRKGGLSRPSPQRGFSIAPLGNPIAPSSVTFGDSFPQGEAFVGGTPPQRKAFSPNPCSRKKRIQIRVRRWAPKQPHHRNNAPQPPKRASGNERALNQGGAGALPRDSLRPGFL